MSKSRGNELLEKGLVLKIVVLRTELLATRCMILVNHCTFALYDETNLVAHDINLTDPVSITTHPRR